MDGIAIRPMIEADLDNVPIAHQGEPAEVAARIADLGSSALLAFDGRQHVGQLQFRRYAAGTNSPDSLWDPLYWMDYGDVAPELPAQTINVFCYHVGQLDESDDRDERYLGKGIGLRLLDELVKWASGNGFEAVVAKASPAHRSVMEFMGGQPAHAYEARGFETVASWHDDDLETLVHDRALVEVDALSDAATVSCCVLRFA